MDRSHWVEAKVEAAKTVIGNAPRFLLSREVTHSG